MRPMGRQARGVRAMELAEGDYLIGMEVVEKEGLILSIAENGFGKRTPLEDYRLTIARRQGRHQHEDHHARPARWSAILSVKEDSELMIVSQNGKIIRIESSTDPPGGPLRRRACGWSDLEEDDRVAAASVIPEADGDDPSRTPAAPVGILEPDCRLLVDTRSPDAEPVAGETGAAVRAPAGHGPRDRGLLRRHGLRVPRLGRAPGAGTNAVAITADSASIPESHKRDAEAFARQFGIRHEYIATHEFETRITCTTIPTAASTARTSCSPGSRKSAQRARHSSTSSTASTWTTSAIIVPARSGRRQHQVTAPLVGCRPDQGRDPRTVAPSRTADLGPSRFGLSQLADSLWNAGDNRDVKTVETGRGGSQGARLPPVPRALPRRGGAASRSPAKKWPKALTLEMAARFTEIFKPLGFHYVTLDLEGYRQGSLNETLDLKKTG